MQKTPAETQKTPVVKRLMWSGLLTGVGALSSIIGARVAGMIWKRVFKEDPPE